MYGTRLFFFLGYIFPPLALTNYNFRPTGNIDFLWSCELFESHLIIQYDRLGWLHVWCDAKI